jgi:hypothetical protein
VLPLIESKEVLPDDYFEYIKESKTDNEKYKVSCNQNSLDDYLVEKYSERLKDYPVLQYIKQSYKLPKYNAKIETEIDTISMGNLELTFNAYKAISIFVPLKKKMSADNIYSLLTSAIVGSPEYFELVAMRLAMADTFANRGGVDLTVLSDTNPQLVKELAKRIEWYTTYNDLLIKSLKFDHPLFKLVVKELTISPYKESTLSLNQVLPKFFELVKAIDVSPEELLKNLDRWVPQFETDGKSNNIKELIPNAEFYSVIFETSLRLKQFVIDKGKEYLFALKSDELAKLFINGDSYELILIEIFIDHDIIHDLPETFVEAYKKAMMLMTGEDFKFNATASCRWNKLYNKLNKHELVSTAKDIRDFFIDNGAISIDKFMFFEELLRNEGSLKDKAADVSRKILNKVKENDEAFSVICKNAAFYCQIIVEAKDDGLDFVRFCRKKIETSFDNSLLASFNSSLNFLLAKSIKINSAFVIVNDKKIDITEKFKELIEKESRLHFLVDRSFFTNYVNDIEASPTLEFEFSIDEEKNNMKIPENNWLSIP